MSVSNRFVGLSLTAEHRARLRKMEACGEKLSVRTWRRVRTLLLLDKGFTVASTAESVGGYPREVSRVGKRYLEGGLEHGLNDDPRPIPDPLLDSTQLAAVVAMVCGPAPSGRARWTVRLVAEHAVARGIAPKMGRETARVALAEHGLKPWREKNVVRAGNRPDIRRSNGGRA